MVKAGHRPALLETEKIHDHVEDYAVEDKPGTTFVLSGRLAGPWVELRNCWLELGIPGESAPCHVDLREVTFIDEAGTTLLSQMYREGGTIQASGCLTRPSCRISAAHPHSVMEVQDAGDIDQCVFGARRQRG